MLKISGIKKKKSVTKLNRKRIQLAQQMSEKKKKNQTDLRDGPSYHLRRWNGAITAGVHGLFHSFEITVNIVCDKELYNI